MSTAVYDIPAQRIDGTPASLGDYRGHVILVVNVASKCGLTPQYEALEKLYEAQRDRGLVIVGFPSNEFGGQEPGSNDEIATFCSTNFNVQFPMFAKIAVNGAERHPLYQSLIAAQPQATEKPGSDFLGKLASYGVKREKPDDIAWNFEKFVIGRDGRVAARFNPDVPPDDPAVLAVIEAELSKT